MALVKTVEMRVLADAGDAQAKLDELDAKGKELGTKDIKMRMRIDESDARGQIEGIRARAKMLGYDDVSIKVKVDGKGRAVADLEAVKHEMDSVGRRSAEGGMLSKLAGGLGSLTEGLPLIGGAGPMGLAGIAAAAAVLLPEIVAVGSGFAAAGTGAGAFALLAAPAVKHVETAYQGLNKAQAAYTAAQDKEKADPTKTNRGTLATAALNLKLAREQLDKMPRSEQDAVRGISGLTTEFGKMSRAFEPQAFRVFASGLKVIDGLLPHVTPFANTFASSLDKLLGQAGKFTQSAGFASWLKQFQSLEGPAAGAIGHGIGEVANQFGKLLTVFSGKDVAHGINIAFGAISGVIGGVRAAIQGLKSAWDSLSQNTSVKRIASDFSKAWDSITKAGGKKPDFSALTSAMKDAASTGITFLSQKLGPLINGALTTAGNWVSQHGGSILVPAGKAIMDGLLAGMRSKLPALASLGAKILTIITEHKGPIEKDRVLLIPHGQAIMQGLITSMQGGLPAVQAAAQAVAGAVTRPFRDATIAAAAKKLEAMAPSSLTSWLKMDTAKLQSLAGQRKMLEAEIQQSEQVAQSTLQASTVMTAATAGPDPNAEPVSTSQVISGMQYQLSQVKQFRQQIQQLKKEGLNATSLSQIIQAGAGPGSQVAQALLDGGKQAVSQINGLQKQLKAQAAALGDEAAPAMYQAGVQAGQGLANGLRSQLGAVAQAMKQLIQEMINEAKSSLKSHSPSLVFAEIGESVPQGTAIGITRAAHLAVAASSRLAGSVIGPWARAGGGQGGGGELHVHFHGVFTGDKMGTAQQVHQLLSDYKTKRGRAPLGLG